MAGGTAERLETHLNGNCVDSCVLAWSVITSRGDSWLPVYKRPACSGSVCGRIAKRLIAFDFARFVYRTNYYREAAGNQKTTLTVVAGRRRYAHSTNDEFVAVASAVAALHCLMPGQRSAFGVSPACVLAWTN